jgi:hypothetical protein
MKNFLKISILLIATISIFAGFTTSVYADSPLHVQFTPDPLFNKPNFLPQDETSGLVTVTNNSGTEQNILTEAINILDNDHFGNLLHLKIVGNNKTFFDDSLTNFFIGAGEVPLGSISSGESKTFTYIISFTDFNNNSYQEKTLGFDVCVGFEGGNSHCGNTIIGDEGGGTRENGNGGVSGGTIYGSGGGSSGSVGISLAISNEQANDVSNVSPSGSVIINWITNKLSTSQVIYGLVSGGPYTLTLIPPNFGYPFYTVEDLTKVTNHSVLLTGLIPGQTYVYRVVSHASPPTISYEHQFTIPKQSVVVKVNEQNSQLERNEKDSFVSETSNNETNNDIVDNSNQTAAAVVGAQSLSSWTSLSIILVIILIIFGLIFFNSKKRNN